MEKKDLLRGSITTITAGEPDRTRPQGRPVVRNDQLQGQLWSHVRRIVDDTGRNVVQACKLIEEEGGYVSWTGRADDPVVDGKRHPREIKWTTAATLRQMYYQANRKPAKTKRRWRKEFG